MWSFQVRAAVGWVGVLWLVLDSPLAAQTLLDQLERRLAEEERADSAAPAAGRIDARPALGISVAAVTDAAVEQYGLPVRQGALVAKVEPAGMAAQHGLQTGDAIVALNGRRIDTPQDLVSLIKRAQPGQTLELTWYSGRRLVRKSLQLQGEVDPFAIASPPARTASSGGARADSNSSAPGAANRPSTGTSLPDAELENRESGLPRASAPSSTAGSPSARPGANSGINSPPAASLPGREPPRSASSAAPGSLGRPLPASPSSPDPFGIDPQGPGNLAAPAGRLADRLESSGRPLLGRLGRLIDRVAGDVGANGEFDPSLSPIPGAESASPPPISSSRLAPARPVAGPTELPRANGQPPTALNAVVPAPVAADNKAVTEEIQRLEQLVIRLQERIQKLEQRLNVLEQTPIRTE